jgi:hypothetical protein
MTRFYFREVFHAVGHGLFTAGALYRNRPPTSFCWVFDCGSKSKRAHLDRELHLFARSLTGECIRLFCISHFDEDHINGARLILEKHRIDRLILPYFPLVERIQIALTTPRISSGYLQFLVDPAGYLFGIAGANLGEIIFIMGGGQPASEPENLGPQNVSPENWNFDVPDSTTPEGISDEDLRGSSTRSPVSRVLVINHSAPFIIGKVWEFVFYNEYSPPDRLRPLREAVIAILGSHKRNDGSFNARQMLPELRKLYSEKLGDSGRQKNRISLVVYSGPLLSNRIAGWRAGGFITPIGTSFPWHGWTRSRFCTAKFSTLHTGDFLLTNLLKLQAMKSHFGNLRWSSLAVIQIPHHGSKSAWFTGAGGHLQHELSVFSSPQGSTSFPAKAVLNDLQARTTSILVNECQRFGFYCSVDVA